MTFGKGTTAKQHRVKRTVVGDACTMFMFMCSENGIKIFSSCLQVLELKGPVESVIKNILK